jgi:hypothetical protein
MPSNSLAALPESRFFADGNDRGLYTLALAGNCGLLAMVNF